MRNLKMLRTIKCIVSVTDMKIICEGRRPKRRNDSSVKGKTSAKVSGANLTKSPDDTKNTLKSTGQDQQLNCNAEKKCARCGLVFIVTSAGKYVMQDQCVYHVGVTNVGCRHIYM
jgi:hypothetical protein